MRNPGLAVALAVAVGLAAAPVSVQVPIPPWAVPDTFGNVGWGASADRAPAGTATVAGAHAAAAACSGFDAETFCQTGWGWRWLGARVVNGVVTFSAWSNLFNVPTPCPLTFTFHFGDGTSETAPGQSTDASSYVQVTHQYALAGTYTIGITASNGTSALSCTMTTITVVPCWQDGVLCYQGERLAWTRGGSEGLLEIDPPVRINQTLYAGGPSRVEYTYQGSTLKTSTFRPTGQLYVPGVAGDRVLFPSPPAFDVRWNEGKLYALDPDTMPLDFRPGGLPIWPSPEPLIVGPSHLVVQPVSVVGVAPGTLELARFSSTWKLLSGGASELLAFSFISDGPAPSMTFGSVKMDYAPPPADTSTVEMALQLPFSGGPSFAAKFQLAPCGLNLADVTLGGLWTNDVPIAAWGPITLGIAGWRSALDHLCDTEEMTITAGGNLEVSIAGVPIPGEFFSIENVALTYQHPLDFRIDGGTGKALGYDVGQLTGFIHGQRQPVGTSVVGTVNIADAFVGRFSGLHSLGRLWLSANIVGIGRVPDFTCRWYDQPCKAMRALARLALGGLPFEVSGQSFHVDGNYNQATGFWQGNVIGEYATHSGTLVVIVQTINGTTSLLVGTNMRELYEFRPPSLAVTSLTAERSVTVPAGLAGITFAATGKETPPASVSLRTPDGRTFTPYSPGYSSFSSSAADQTALFEVPYPAAGTWTLAAEGVGADEVALFAFAPKAKPALAFTRVDQGDTAVAIEASVDPPSASTRVQLFYGMVADGGVGEPIGDPLDGAAGAVTASWDISGMSPGTYYVFAQATEEGTFPVTTYAPVPVVIGGATALDAPGGLTAGRDGDAVALTWTPATAPEAVAHAVLYTDRPDVAGYPYTHAATHPGQATIPGLPASRGYRFVAVAVDGQGAYGPPSNEVVLAGVPSACQLVCATTAPATAARREPLRFAADVTSVSCDEPVSVAWTFGDGTGARGAAASHAYAAAGSYSWQATALSGAGSCSAAGTVVVSDGDPAPRRQLRRHLTPQG